jgi:HEAT repeat protein
VGFKEDADFARFVSMGAAATDAVRADLRERFGHRVVELERYAMANKVWHTKVKRLRLPDLVCIDCGLRIESRGKSQLGIILSHSDAEGRSWDAGGMGDHDLYAFLRVVVAGDEVHTSTPVYFRTDDLRSAVEHAKRSAPKAMSQGSEVTLTWQSWVAGQSGVVVEVDEKGRILCRWESGKTYRYGSWRKWPQRHLYVEPGEPLVAGETIVAGIVKPATELHCPGSVWNVEGALRSEDPSTRYAALRAAGLRGDPSLVEAVVATAADEGEDWRIRLEATASIARLGDHDAIARIAELALAEDSDSERQMEAVFVLSELPIDQARAALRQVALWRDGPSELRSAAVWGLAQGIAPDPSEVLEFTADDDLLVAAHAVAGMPALTAAVETELVEWLLGGDGRHRAVAAALLVRSQRVEPLLRVAAEEGPARLWALRALGDIPEAVIREAAGNLLTDDVEKALAPFWVGQKDWVRTDAAEAVGALDVQKVRFNPLG